VSKKERGREEAFLRCGKEKKNQGFKKRKVRSSDYLLKIRLVRRKGSLRGREKARMCRQMGGGTVLKDLGGERAARKVVKRKCNGRLRKTDEGKGP